ncbi:hypothetical protein Mal15_26680 [Stieleria maiorica]|uniref:Spore protein YkvP/CgeB glycosyl transferase-like domain-containing protein n=1 Tax=Stieleria maiorica TaxID=2795974 RepID=A0A5B9MCV0_9BACT|nr:glycosyltransferase [Stieleria maiorica]QEF98613.1 hypothetical protein Mal15_26680 [Stieleria maiorica]
MSDGDEISFQDGTIMLVADAAPFSTRDVWEGYLEGLTEIGANVLPYPTFSILELLSPNLLGSDLIGKAMDIRNGVQAIVFISGMYFRDSRSWVVESLTHRGMPTVLIATDDPYEPIGMHDGYSMRFSNELSCVNGRAKYLPTATMLPPALDDDPWVRDLVFVGTVFEDRWEMLRQIAMYCEINEYRFDIFGHFPSRCDGLQDLEFVRLIPGTVSAEQKWSLYSQSKMVLNLFRDSGDQPARSASPRVYEVAALGRPALISNRREELEQIFGDSIYLFDDIDGFGERFEEAIDSTAERKQKVDRAQQTVFQGHLYQHRASQLLGAIRDHLAE